MTAQKKIKQKIRARMEKTGERYAAARTALLGPSHKGPSFRTIVLEVIARGEAVNREREVTAEQSSDGQYGMSLEEFLGPEESEVESTVEAALRQYLASLSDDDLLRLQTLMYTGRGDDEGDIRWLHEYLIEATPDREDAIRTLMNKTPLPEYLRDGLAVADRRGFDVEGPF